jgi:RNA polymerase sigma factor (sigma-70 family)
MALILDTSSIASLGSEADLIEAARAGDDRAFEELYARYSERIRLFILGRLHDHGRAEDIAQEVFMSALKRMRATSQPIAFKPWIYEIAKNACIDEHRRARRTNEVSLDADDELISGRRALRSLGPTPPAAAESRQRLADLRGAFGGLSESHHRLLVMREFEGLSYNEIARQTGMSRQMVESSLFRARRKLADEYDELASGRRCEHVQSMIDGGRAHAARSLGIRERRRLARHFAHCQPCRVRAHIAGVDESLLKPRSVADKIAALLPFGIWRWPWRGGSGARHAIAQTGTGAKRVVARTGSHPLTLQSVQSAASIPDPAGTASSLGGAAIAAAVIALAGAGGAIVSSDAGPGHARPTPGTLAPAAHGTAAGRTQSTPGVSAPGHGRRATAGSNRGAVRSTPSQPRSARSPVTSTGHGQAAGSKPGAASGAASSSTGKPAGAVGSPQRAGSHPAKTAAKPIKAAGSTVHQAGSTLKQAGSSTLKQAGSTVHRVGNTLTKTLQQTGTTVSKTVSSLGKAVSSTTSSLGKAVSGATSALGKTASGATSSVGKTVSGATSSVGKTVSGATSSVGKTASSATSAVSKTVGSTTSSASKTVSSTTSSLTKTVNGTVSSVTSPKSSSSKASSGGTAASAVTGTVKKVGSTVSGLLP